MLVPNLSKVTGHRGRGGHHAPHLDPLSAHNVGEDAVAYRVIESVVKAQVQVDGQRRRKGVARDGSPARGYDVFARCPNPVASPRERFRDMAFDTLPELV